MSGRDAWIEKVREKDAEIDMLRKALGTAGERINTQDAEIERLNKCLEQAIEWMGPTDAHLLPEAEYPELYAHLKEKENQAWMEAGL